MSFNRKRKLRNITAAILGAVSMGGGLQTQATGTENQLNEGTNWAKWGVLSTGALGLGGLGLAAYNALRTPQVDELQRRHLQLLVEKAEKEKDEETAMETAKSILSCTEEDIDDMIDDLRVMAGNEGYFAMSTITKTFGTEDGKRLWKAWKSGADDAGKRQSNLLTAIAKYTAEKLDNRKIADFFGEIRKHSGLINKATHFYAVKKMGIGKVSRSLSTAWSDRSAVMKLVEYANLDGKMTDGLSLETVAELQEKNKEEKQVILKLIPESIRDILPNGCEWALNALPTKDGGLLNESASRDENINSWETRKGLKLQKPKTDDCLVWAELGDNSIKHGANNSENVILGGGFLEGEGMEKVSEASEMNKAMFKGLKEAMIKNT
jgi:hypothetical protein